MKLSNGEKLILIMLSDLHKKLDIKGEIDADFVQSAIFSDNPWGFDWKYGEIIDNDDGDTPKVVRDVCNYLEMWGCLEASWPKLSKDEKAQIAVNAEPFGSDVKFPGFDGNNEIEHMNVARFLVDDLGRFASFKARGDLNSHCPSVETYARMYRVFEAIQPSLQHGIMNARQVTDVLQAMHHPSHTKTPAS
jgi:uncharacterized protein YfbU (UPF0304 family)